MQASELKHWVLWVCKTRICLFWVSHLWKQPELWMAAWDWSWRSTKMSLYWSIIGNQKGFARQRWQRRANTPASCSKQAARATPKGSAYCKGPLDRLLTVRYACFVPVMAINKPDFMAGYSVFYESARYGGDFMAAIENNRDFSLSRDFRLSPSSMTNPKVSHPHIPQKALNSVVLWGIFPARWIRWILLWINFRKVWRYPKSPYICGIV